MRRLSSFRAHFDPEILKSLRWQYFLNIGVGLLGAAYILAISRLLGPSAFGVYALCTALPTVTAALLEFRLQEFVIFLKEHSERQRFVTLLAAVFWFDVLTKLLAAACAIGAAALLEVQGYEGIESRWVIVAAILVLSTKTLSGPAMGILRSHGKLEYFSLAQVGDWTFRLIALAALAFADDLGIASILWSQVAVGALFNLAVIRRALIEVDLPLARVATGWKHLPALVRENARYMFPNQGISATEAVVKELDVLVCGLFLTTAQVGTYKVAKSMAAIAWRLADPIFIVILPKLARLHSLGQAEELRAFVRTLTLVLAPSGMILFAASVAGVWLVGPLALGPDYADAIRLFPVAASWMLVALPLVWTHSLSVASGRPLIQFAGSGLGNAIGLAAIWIGAWQVGIAGALVGLSLAYALPFVFAFLLLRRLRAGS